MAKKNTNKKEVSRTKVKKVKSKTVAKVLKSKMPKKNVTVKKNLKENGNSKKIVKRKRVKKEIVVVENLNPENKKVEKKRVQKVEDDNPNFAKWIAPEHVKTNGDMILYYISSVLALIAIGYNVLQGSFIPVVTFTMMLIVVMLYIFYKPSDIEYKIDLDGISINDRLYIYDNISAFQVIEGEEYNLLKFSLKNSILPVKTIYLIDQNPLYIRAILENFLSEGEVAESLIGYEKKDNSSEYISDEDIERLIVEKEEEEKKNKI